MAYGVKASTNMRSNSALQLPTAWAFDSGFKAGSQRSPRQRARPFQMMSGPQPLLLRWIHHNKTNGTYTLTLIRHWDLQTNLKLPLGIFTKVKYLLEMSKPARLFKVKGHFCCAMKSCHWFFIPFYIQTVIIRVNVLPWRCAEKRFYNALTHFNEKNTVQLAFFLYILNLQRRLATSQLTSVFFFPIICRICLK